MIGIKNKIKELNDLKKSVKIEIEHIPDDYIVGYYNGIEKCLAVLEKREPEYMVATHEAEEIKTEQPKQNRTLYGGIIK